MNRFRKKAQALTRKTVGQMIGDDKLVHEGLEQERHAEEQKEQASSEAKTAEAESWMKSKSDA